MMKALTVSTLLCLSCAIGTAQFNYVFTTSMETYTDLTGATSLNNGEVWDDPDYVVDIPFSIEVNGVETTSLTFIGLGSDVGFEISPDVFMVILPFSADLIDRGFDQGTSLSPISYKVDGDPGSRIFKMEWKNAGSYDELYDLGTTNMFVNLQLWLYEGSNRIEYRYGPSMIDNPDVFYFGEPGAYIGIVGLDYYGGGYIDPHFLTGPASDPDLTDELVAIEGTPEDGMVYRFSVDALLEVEVIGTDGICGLANGSATANPTGGIDPYTYAWSNGESTQMITDLEAGSYTVTVTDDLGSTATGSVVISSGEPVSPNADATDETGVDANDGTAWAAPTGGTAPYSYLWSNGSQDEMITGLAPGIYTVTVTDVDGCTGVQSVTVNAFGCTDMFLEAALSNISCFGECNVSIVILDITGGTAPFTYAWSTGSTESEINDLCAGVYSVTVTDANGCVGGDTYQIFEPEELLANAVATDETSDGANDGTATSTPTGGIEPYEFLWSNGSTDAMITGLAPGEYTVTVTDANFCADTQTVVVNASGCAMSLTAEIIDNVCFGDCTGSITITPVDAILPVTYLWGDGSTDSTLTSLCAGTYFVTVTDGTGCTLEASYSVAQPTAVLANAGSTDETMFGFDDGTAWAAPTGGTAPYSYLWSNGAVDSLLTNLAPGDYTVTVSDAIGCENVQTVTVNEALCFSLLETSFTNISCHGACDGSVSFIIFNGVGPFSFLWSTGDTTNTASNLCAGTYTVTITDLGQGCSGEAAFTLEQPDLLVLTIDEIINITDSTESGISISVAGGTPPYTYAWSGPDGYTNTSEDISGMDEGLYNVIVTDANGCTTGVDSVEVVDETVSVRDLQTLDVRVYPNPAQHVVYLEIAEVNDFVIQLYTLQGQMIQHVLNSNTISVRGYEPGMYILKITSGEKQFAGRLAVIK